MLASIASFGFYIEKRISNAAFRNLPQLLELAATNAMQSCVCVFNDSYIKHPSSRSFAQHPWIYLGSFTVTLILMIIVVSRLCLHFLGLIIEKCLKDTRNSSTTRSEDTRHAENIPLDGERVQGSSFAQEFNKHGAISIVRGVAMVSQVVAAQVAVSTWASLDFMDIHEHLVLFGFLFACQMCSVYSILPRGCGTKNYLSGQTYVSSVGVLMVQVPLTLVFVAVAEKSHTFLYLRYCTCVD